MKRLNILAPTRYPWSFNGPRNSQHNIVRRNFLPLNKISQKIEGITFISPLGLTKFNLVHGFNRIPLGPTPFVIGFESHLPRAFGYEHSALFTGMSKILASRQCRGIVAISEFARKNLLSQHEGRPWFHELAEKTIVRYPNIIIPQTEDNFELKPDEPVKLTFVGNHFARKGGIVAIRLAALAAEQKIPIQVDIISSLEVGETSWVDPPRPGFFDSDFKKLHTLANIKNHGPLPNGQVLKILDRSHFLLLPTFSDTFGFSAIEAMARHTPVIGTTQGCMDEYIHNDENGILLKLDQKPSGEWLHLARPDRNSKTYEKIFNDECNRLAEEALGRIIKYINKPTAYKGLRTKAYETARSFFSDADANQFWDNYYLKAMS